MAADGAELGPCRRRSTRARPGPRRLLLVLQGMDTAGKGGVIEHVVGAGEPAGLHIASFKTPTPEELRHHFLWRIRRALRRRG